MKTRPGTPGQEWSAPARTTGLPAPAERGATVIPDRVVARIAAQAAHTAQSRHAGVPPDRGSPDTPSASAAVRLGTVRLHLTYPTDIPRACERIQQDVAEKVAQLTGLRVGEVLLTVRRLMTAADTSRGRVR